MEWNSTVRRQFNAILLNTRRIGDERLAQVMEAQLVELMGDMTDQVNAELRRRRLTPSHPTGRVVTVATDKL